MDEDSDSDSDSDDLSSDSDSDSTNKIRSKLVSDLINQNIRNDILSSFDEYVNVFESSLEMHNSVCKLKKAKFCECQLFFHSSSQEQEALKIQKKRKELENELEKLETEYQNRISPNKSSITKKGKSSKKRKEKKNQKDAIRIQKSMKNIELSLLVPRTVDIDTVKFEDDSFEYIKKKDRNTKEYRTKKLEILRESFFQLYVKENECYDRIIRRVTRELLEWRKPDLNQFIDLVSEFDCIFSFFETINRSDGSFSKPTILDSKIHPNQVIDIKGLFHPVVKEQMNHDYITSNFRIGSIDGNYATSLILTGPNASGKSSMLRSVCIAILCAQIGFFVPAESMTFTLIDRIFTRIGSNDQIITGESSFVVEMNETANILKKATKNSFIILDELGRGTCTKDGSILAYFTITYLSEVIKPLTVFATHMHRVVEKLRKMSYPFIDFFRMGYLIDENQEEKKHSSSGTNDRIIFTYKFEKGICKNSFGLNVARLAGLDYEMIKEARKVSKSYINFYNKNSSQIEKREEKKRIEMLMNRIKLIVKVCKSKNIKKIQQAIDKCIDYVYK